MKYFRSDEKQFPDFPSNKDFPEDMRDIFYLLGDFNFKNSNFPQSIPYFQLDLTFNSRRLDSYVQLALASANVLEDKLAQTYSENISDILEESKGIMKMFRVRKQITKEDISKFNHSSFRVAIGKSDTIQHCSSRAQTFLS